MSRHRDDRPHPIRHEQTWIGVFTAAGVIGGTVGLTQIQALADSAPQIIGSLAAGGVLVQNKIIEKRAEKHVTPTADPRDDQGRRLVPVEEPPSI